MTKISPSTVGGEFKKSILEDAERLADAIEKLAATAEGLRGSRLKDKAILVLLSHYSGLPKGTISKVLEGLVNIKREYLK